MGKDKAKKREEKEKKKEEKEKKNDKEGKPDKEKKKKGLKRGFGIFKKHHKEGINPPIGCVTNTLISNEILFIWDPFSELGNDDEADIDDEDVQRVQSKTSAKSFRSSLPQSPPHTGTSSRGNTTMQTFSESPGRSRLRSDEWPAPPTPTVWPDAPLSPTEWPLPPPPHSTFEWPLPPSPHSAFEWPLPQTPPRSTISIPPPPPPSNIPPPPPLPPLLSHSAMPQSPTSPPRIPPPPPPPKTQTPINASPHDMDRLARSGWKLD